MTDVPEGATGESGFTSVWDQRPKHASGGQHSRRGNHAYETEGCCYSPFTLVLVVLASLCFIPSGWIARRYYAQGETQKAQMVSIIGIIVGTIIAAGVIAVLVLFLTGRFG